MALNYTVIRLGFSATGIYKKRQSQKAASPYLAKVSGDYFVLNLKCEMQTWRSISAFVQVDNVTDSNYADLLGTQMPGRWLMGGLKMTF